MKLKDVRGLAVMSTEQGATPMRREAVEYPLDLLAIQTAHVTDFNLGDSTMLRDRPRTSSSCSRSAAARTAWAAARDHAEMRPEAA